MSNTTTKAKTQTTPSTQAAEGINDTTIPVLADPGETLGIPGREAEESKVRELHKGWLGIQRTSAEVAGQLGAILAELKAELRKTSPKRRWEPYVRDHLGINPRTASNYMRIARMARQIALDASTTESETVSEIGVREVLDRLAELDKAAKAGVTRTKVSGGAKESKAGAFCGTSGPRALRLADGRSLDIGRLPWVEGPIDLHSIESWIGRFQPDPEDTEAPKFEARRQQAVVHIAAGINRACGNSRLDSAVKLAKSAIEEVAKLLPEDSAK